MGKPKLKILTRSGKVDRLIKYFLFLLLVSCTPKSKGVKMGNDIPVAEQQKIKILVYGIYSDIIHKSADHINAIYKGNMRTLNMYLDFTYLKYGLNFDTSRGYQVLDQYYSDNDNPYLDSVDAEKYVYRFKRFNKTYLYSFTLKSADHRSTSIVYCVFKKKDNDWVLVNINIGLYDINNHTATDLYNMATNHLSKGDRLSAYLNLKQAYFIILPRVHDYNDNNEKKILSLLKELKDTLKQNHQFPIRLAIWGNNVELSEPTFGFHKGTIFPYIICITDQNVLDTVRMRRMSSYINKSIEGYFSDIYKMTDTVKYTFYHTGDSINKSSPHFNSPMVKDQD